MRSGVWWQMPAMAPSTRIYLRKNKHTKVSSSTFVRSMRLIAGVLTGRWTRWSWWLWASRRRMHFREGVYHRRPFRRASLPSLPLRSVSPPHLMPAAKRQRKSADDQDGVAATPKKPVVHESDASATDDEGDFGDESGSEQSGSADESSPDTEDEIAGAKRTKSKKTLKRKRRATDATRFGATLQSLLNTTAPSALPLSLKPSIARRRNNEKLEAKGKKVILVERKEKEERGRIKDVIGGWGGESERALRKVAQRGGE